jgi:hypothetical protein
MRKKTKYQAQGKDYEQGKFVDKELDFDLPDPPANAAGIPISKAAFDAMRGDYDPGPGGTQSVTFSREALLTTLAQYGCAGIKFYFAKRNGRITLIMVGVDNTGTELTNKAADLGTQATLYSDWGHCNPPCP